MHVEIYVQLEARGNLANCVGTYIQLEAREFSYNHAGGDLRSAGG